MSKFITGKELEDAVYTIIWDAERTLLIVSPYIKLDDYFKNLFKKHIDNYKLQILLIFGKNEKKVHKSLSNEDFDFFKSEDELRKLCSLPSTRRKLLEELGEKGYSSAQLDDLRRLVHGEDSDLYDVLNYVAYHVDLVPRLERATKAKIHFNEYNSKQQKFLNFVLDQYVREGVEELDDQKLSPLLVLKYKAISDAKKELGDIPSIRNAFVGFQQHLYGQVVNSSIN